MGGKQSKQVGLDHAYKESLEAQKVLLDAIARGDQRSVRTCLEDHDKDLQRFNLLEPALRQALEQHQLDCAVRIMNYQCMEHLLGVPHTMNRMCCLCLHHTHWLYVVVDCVRAGKMTRSDVQSLLQREDITLFSRVRLAVLLGETDYVVRAATSESRSRLTPDDWSRVLGIIYYKDDMSLASLLQQQVQLTVNQDLLFHACCAGDTDFITRVVTGRRHTDGEVDWDNFMWAVCMMGHSDLITTMARHRLSDGELVLACAAGDLPAVQRRLTDNIDDSKWYCYLTAACLAGHTHVCDFLMEFAHQADVDVGDLVKIAKYQEQYVYYAFDNTIDDTTIDFIQKKQVEIYKPDITMLHEYCYKGNSLNIQLYAATHGNILKHVNEAGYHGYSPLHLTVLGHDDDVEDKIDEVSYTTENLSRLNYLDRLYSGSLHRITERVRIVHCLLDHGAIVNCQDVRNRTPLHMAAFSGGLDFLPILLDAGAHIDAQDAIGMTPIAYASGEGHYRIVEYLIKRNCDVTISNIDGKTPLYHARKRKKRKCAKLLAKEHRRH